METTRLLGLGNKCDFNIFHKLSSLWWWDKDGYCSWYTKKKMRQCIVKKGKKRKEKS